MTIKKIVPFIFIFINISTLSAQKKLFKRFFGQDSSKKASFLPLPAISYAQETGLEFGAIGIYSFYTDTIHRKTRNSNILFGGSYTTRKQIHTSAKADIWSKNNTHHYIGAISYRDFPYNYYGIGDRTPEQDKDIINWKQTHIRAGAEKAFGEAIYIGASINFEHHQFSDRGETGIYNNTFLIGKTGGKAIFLSLSQTIDTRDNINYTTKGTYLRIAYAYAPNFFGENHFEGSRFGLNFRTFRKLDKKRTILGLHAVYQTIQGSRIPFYLLQHMGNDEIMRGYYNGRYRDQNLLAAQAEVRYRPVPFISLVGFAAAGSVYSPGKFKIDHFKPGYGAGFRYFFNLEKALSLRFDYAFGEKRSEEKRQQGFYISLSEAF